MSSGKQRPTPGQMVLVMAIGAAAIAFVVVVTLGLLGDGVGTGNPLDYYRAIGRELTDPGNWRVIGLSAAAGAGVTALVLLLARRGRR
ncbi:hypothetical protein LEP48_17200 [Isoptericola sp. NEAU-Y5]|uniref:Integral membrane protein n=1 Tax=Isoptericola luteus TaxID=2879484 RepID=A0ABS7ZMG3_9MICO|nr:hypothetical protein [Isoptericola sp. NEAU-Y5]MCA5895069.1 hypothetical protein [Isoptericola sp. NEAU-Y5]